MMIHSEEHNELCVGIDLGTTNSVLATINTKANGDIVSKVVGIPRAVNIYSTTSSQAALSTEKRMILPSYVYYREEKNYEALVGDFAKVQYALRPHLVAKSIKSQMGRPYAEGLSPDVPDKTPADISARILRHLLYQAERMYHCPIDDAVITVPANFDSAMCKATRDAAEKAGIKVRNKDGSERAVLLPEPNAVIYDLINQIHNGEISSRIIDLSTKKNVLVFDLGGGTLDITLHEIKRREDCAEVLKVEEIATNRYTLLGGDDFDEEIAQTMFERYLCQYSKYPEIVKKLTSEKKIVMPQLRTYAENLKIRINEECSEEYHSGWDDEGEETLIPVGGNIGGIGYAYDDSFGKEDVEKILRVFMGENLRYSDYKRIDQISAQGNTRNIIYPILDVLNKAAQKSETGEARVDAVLLNGGMSKFYMVVERLKNFFGMDPIVALDPDQSVARGAAVYHYYLHKYETIQDDMRLVGLQEGQQMPRSGSTFAEEPQGETSVHPRKTERMAIEWGQSILNDSLYLGLRNGGIHRIIPTGAKLPYHSEIQNGFRLEAGQKSVAIPIKTQSIDGTYRTIASGKIEFSRHYPEGAYISFTVDMSSSKIVTMRAWTSLDAEGKEKLEEGDAVIVIEEEGKAQKAIKMSAPNGSNLKPVAEIHTLIQLCNNLKNAVRQNQKSELSKKIKALVTGICNAGNPEAFAEEVLKALSEQNSNDELRNRLFTIARKIGESWSGEQKRRLAHACKNQLAAEFQGMESGGSRTNVNIQAVYALSMCGSREQLSQLSALHEKKKYIQSCLYTHAKTKTQVEWIYRQFLEDKKNALKNRATNLQESSYAIGVAFRIDGTETQTSVERAQVIRELCGAIRSGFLKQPDLICSLLALGWICDQRTANNPLDNSLLREAIDAEKVIDDVYPVLTVLGCSKARTVARKMIDGEGLNDEEEQFLLIKLNC